MKNITVTVDDDLYFRARLCAAERRTTLSALVRRFVQGIVNEETPFERMQREQNDVLLRLRSSGTGPAASGRLSREEVHSRDAVR
jgi:antitoxin component of RelBE/YafQ-DinJ toxin-antitoxin module